MNQHTAPCRTCPFLRSSVPGKLGGSAPEVFVGQCYGPFWIPCHEVVDYSDPNWRTNYAVGQCAGAAIYRANAHRGREYPPALLLLPRDKVTVFETPAEFLSHHKMMELAVAGFQLGLVNPAMLCSDELNKEEVKPVPLVPML